MNGAEQGVFAFDLSVADQGDERFFEAERAFLFGDGDFLMEVLKGVAADVVTSAVADHEEFGGGNAAASLFGEQDLGVDGGEGHGQFLADGILALHGKRVGDAGDGRGDVGSVQGAKDEMAGFGSGYGDAHGFGVAHFAYDDDVGGLAKCGAERGGKVGGVDADFYLFDNAADVLMLILDGIFDDDDVAGFAVVNVVDEHGHGGGFARTGGSADEHQAALQMRQEFDRGGKMQILERRHASRKDADRGGGAALFAMEIDTKATEPLDAVGSIGDKRLAIVKQGVTRERWEHGGFNFRAVQNAGFNLADFAIYAHARWGAGDEE